MKPAQFAIHTTARIVAAPVMTPAPATAPVSTVLIIALETGRMGPARLPEAFAANGIAVAALAPAGDLLGKSAFLAHNLILPDSRREATLARAVAAAMELCRPRLVIPADEQTVVLLQGFVRGRMASVFSADARACLAGSLGARDGFGAMVFKSDTLAVARALGVPTPASVTVANRAEARAAGAALGYPVYCKRSFSWAGNGLARCDDAVALDTAWGADARAGLAGLKTRLKALVRRARGRNWYPVDSATDIQAAIPGTPASYTALAWKGRLVGGFAVTGLRQRWENGPCAAVRLHADPRLEAHCQAMIAALGVCGFVGFDFLVPADGSEPVLIECNPRPVPTTHLGRRVGVDLVAALGSILAGARLPRRPLAPDGTLSVLLFPDSLDPAQLEPGQVADIPQAEPGLIAACAGSRPELRLAKAS